VATVVDDDVEADIFAETFGQKLRVILAADFDLDTVFLLILAAGVDIDPVDGTLWKIGFQVRSDSPFFTPISRIETGLSRKAPK